MSTEPLPAPPAEVAVPMDTAEEENKVAAEDVPVQQAEEEKEPAAPTAEPPKEESPKKEKAPEFKVHIPRISSREIHSQRAHSPVNEWEQRDFLFLGPGSKRDPNKVRIKSLELEECVKRAKKYAMEQSVRFVLVKQQQQQQKQQLDLIKKQQALLLMCR